ncbi:capsule biosynthesis protein [Paracoccus sp. (in: a-proteobacteria)]|uniref:capsule biosynthesis protein n=1 Tax=Paracoccus sp. TaxID=267 RepID=UPI0026DF314B|nr:capsule biosynthesis protein CapA [Paracoccus sp. (in: a-proteobacteria)]MDO5371212.1 capsule biosynthesis protein CapA [Paracoccus sp. (in: a-proteobacteria)]
MNAFIKGIPAQPSRMAHLPPDKRVFLLLQGPHGPFFDRLARLLRAAGATTWRVGFNAGDEFFWRDRARFVAHSAGPDAWPDHLERLITEKKVTDIVLYGDVRPIHAAAREAAARRGLVLHVFEEGYLRPYWITYERGGSNGFSALMDIDLDRMRAVQRAYGAEVNRPPAHWGDMRQHKFYGALYHFMVLVANGRYPGFSSHRDISLWREFRLNLSRLLLSPLHAARRRRQARAIRAGGFPYVLVLMQLEHDSSFRAHSPYLTMSDFTAEVLEAFARAAPRHHHIVFKAHPLEDGRAHLQAAITAQACALGIADRVHFVGGGKLAGLLSQARSAVTINSTAAQQALWRGLPVKALGRSVYAKPGLVSDQGLDDFLRRPAPPDQARYRDYRNYLLDTCQVPGGFYAARSRAHALRLVVDMMLDPDDPYAALEGGHARYRQQMDILDH